MILGLEALMKGPGGGHGGGAPSGGDRGGGRGFGPGGRPDQGGGGPAGEGGGFGPGGRADQGGGTGPSIVAQASMSPVAAAILASQGADHGEDAVGAFGPGGVFGAGPSPTGTDVNPTGGGGGVPTPGGPFGSEAGEGGGGGGVPAMAMGPTSWSRGQAFVTEGGGRETSVFTHGISAWTDPGQAAGILVQSIMNLSHSFSGNRFYYTVGVWTPPIIAVVLIVSLIASGRSR